MVSARLPQPSEVTTSSLNPGLHSASCQEPATYPAPRARRGNPQATRIFQIYLAGKLD
jgi:hypothetical protein